MPRIGIYDEIDADDAGSPVTQMHPGIHSTPKLDI